MSDFGFRGVSFHNGGATISGLKFNMIPMELDGQIDPIDRNLGTLLTFHCHMPKTPDSPQLIEQLKSQGAKLRLRKSGQVHTIDFSAADPRPGDADIEKLHELQSLEVLDCQDAPLTDSAIDALLKHETLKLLTLSGTNITTEGLKRLRQNMIGCRIIG